MESIQPDTTTTAVEGLGAEIRPYRFEPAGSESVVCTTELRLEERVVQLRFQNAASIAGLLLTTECVVVEKKEDKPAPAEPPGGGMGGMY